MTIGMQRLIGHVEDGFKIVIKELKKLFAFYVDLHAPLKLPRLKFYFNWS